MSKYGFLDILEEEMDKVFPFDFEINWDKKNHAVEVAFLLEVQNTGGVALVDEAGEESDEDIFFEEAVLFYNPAKSHVEEDAYLTAIPYEPKKGLSREFLAYLRLSFGIQLSWPWMSSWISWQTKRQRALRSSGTKKFLKKAKLA